MKRRRIFLLINSLISNLEKQHLEKRFKKIYSVTLKISLISFPFLDKHSIQKLRKLLHDRNTGTRIFF